MNYIIKFDNREKEIIKLFEEKGYILEKENLDLGDIQFIDIETKNIIIIIERKTLSDLSASIKDGRYKEQKERLIHSIDKNVRKIILIEGSNMYDFDLPLKTYQSIIINTLIRDNIHIHITNNINETVEFIENIIFNIPKYYNDLKNNIINGISNIHQISNIQMVKKDNLTPEICFRNMLCQINGISNKIALVFVKKYINMKNFIKSFENMELKNIINTIANEKNETNNRKIGVKIAEKICIYILGYCNKDFE
jgi:crossover junction endonuclease MUS81